MKTKLLIAMLLLFATNLMAQKEIIEEVQQEVDIPLARLRTVEGLLQEEQKMLEVSKGNTSITQQIAENITKYAKERDALIASIETIKENKIKSLKPQTDDLEKKITDLAPVKKEGTLTDEEKKTAAKNEKEIEKHTVALKKIKELIVQIKEIGAKETASKPINVAKANVNEAKYMLMNGFNFDMNSVEKLKYVGHFNIYIPATKTNFWGINTGLLKVNYLNRDSLITNRVDKVLVNPLDQLAVNSTYNRKYNRYARITEASSYSAYFQLMQRIFKRATGTLYFHQHMELLVSRYVTTTKVKTIATAATTINTEDEIPATGETVPVMVLSHVDNNTFYSGYFGLGLTLDFAFRDNCSLFFQATGGATVKHPDNDPKLETNGESNFGATGDVKGFYLVRSYFKYHTSTSSQIVIGTDIRSIPNKSPLVSIYAGLNLGIDKIADLFKDK